jgi:hypothetical protein
LRESILRVEHKAFHVELLPTVIGLR